MDDATLSLGADAGASTAGPPVGEAFATALAAAFRALPDAGSPAAADFARQAAADLREDELAGAGDRRLRRAAPRPMARPYGARGAASRPSRSRRATGEGGRPLDLDLLPIAQDDAPFLVDSVMGELAEQGLGVRAMVHPVVEEGGRRTSLIGVLLDPVGEDRRAAVVEGVRATLADVRAAVADHDAMRALMDRTIAELETSAALRRARAAETRDEDVAFLRWLAADRFVFLGARDLRISARPERRLRRRGAGLPAEGSLGVLRDPARTVLRRASEPAMLTRQLSAYLDAADPAGGRQVEPAQRVHRRVYMDYIGVKRYGADGKAAGEIRFVGLFTAEAYDEPRRRDPADPAQGGERAGPRRARTPARTPTSGCATSSRTIRATSCSR